MAENSQDSVQNGRRRTRPELSAQDRLDILAQAVLDLASTGIHARVANLHGNGVAIILDNTIIRDGKIIATTGNGGNNDRN